MSDNNSKPMDSMTLDELAGVTPEEKAQDALTDRVVAKLGVTVDRLISEGGLPSTDEEIEKFAKKLFAEFGISMK